jgi:hypothetical protein
MHQSNSELVHAFPEALRDDAVLALSAFPENPRPSNTFSATVADQVVALPLRIYHNPAMIDTVPLNSLQKELVDCLLTRHHDGIVRERHLTRIISLNHIWIPPFVIQLVGEYVIEILYVIRHNLNHLDASMYEEFLRANPELLGTTKRRVTSYWDCYYRNCGREEYVGFQLLDFLESLVGNGQ